MQTGTGVISVDTSVPAMNMPPPGGMSLQYPGGMAPPGVHVMAVPVTPGIAVLAQVQGICMRQNIRLAELLIGFEQKNRFKVLYPVAPSAPLFDTCLHSTKLFLRPDYGETCDDGPEPASL